eukprot:CAMPEP_0174719962 /NCGR_PEP_ID=MMETSP1094-20130205/32454_1 /TAXON_ID=156173 /ORGANISM="Chrysochromulina brevifilum, Strain UTEX LB 985" /LENGTH=33 /DNA_ID= /DNA_START= /DNA_END= /DNA_ORIENTATION=
MKRISCERRGEARMDRLGGGLGYGFTGSIAGTT